MNADRSRAAALEAATKLAQRLQVDALSVDAVCTEANIDTATFAREFGHLDRYLGAVLDAFFERARNRIIAATSGLPAGMTRLQLATETYLSACLDERALLDWLLPLRQRARFIDHAERARRIFRVIVGAELLAMGWRHPRDGARLFTVVVDATSRLEHQTGQPLPRTREAMWHFLQHAPTPP
ncbi:MAG: hypothetical protein PHP86_09270 [Nevskiales bacterium]|nr:hypothetical protein [Nevskiales bacterium]